MPRQRNRKWCHGNISVPVAHGDTGAKEMGVSMSRKDGGVLPDSGFPRDGDMANEECAKTIRTRPKHRVHLIQHMHSVHERRLGVIPLKHAFSERFESSREVVVHGSSWEVVVHVSKRNLTDPRSPM